MPSVALAYVWSYIRDCRVCTPRRQAPALDMKLMAGPKREERQIAGLFQLCVGATHICFPLEENLT